MSVVIMVAVAGTALWLGSWPWLIFVCAVAAGVLWEWRALARGFARTPLVETGWTLVGVAYIGIAAAVLLALRDFQGGTTTVLEVAAMVIATDVGAYFVGRTIGGPKIAPKISPSKTWAGLVGGITAAALVYAVFLRWVEHEYDPARWPAAILSSLLEGGLVAIVAQTGDFFESWMKRRAGVKDSGKLIPGHGGLFDRVDGLLAVLFVIGIFLLVGAMTAK